MREKFGLSGYERLRDRERSRTDVGITPGFKNCAPAALERVFREWWKNIQLVAGQQG